MRRAALHLLTLLASGTTPALSWTWPNPKLDALDDIYTVATGPGTTGLIDGINPCSFAPSNEGSSGRQAAAEWLRVAYHDMATHNVEDGTGGIDASIGWETDRPENVGSAMNDTLSFFRPLTSKYVSMSDVIALGALLSVRICNGPTIPFRAGRVDATGPGPSGVPEPQQDLASHTASFERQGFNVTDMIGLVACGHTLGGVHEVDFPNTVHGVINTTNTEGMVHFDDSPSTFDNHIATEWVQNTTQNPLAVGFNATTNSDARIFSADGNTTMRAFAADNAKFVSRCGELLARMIDTVPSTVELSDPIVPLAVKPWLLQLSVDYAGQLRLAGYIRTFDTEDGWSPSSMSVNITWKDRGNNACENCTVSAPFMGPYSTSLWGNPAMFRFNQTIEPTAGISSFVVDWARNASSPAIHADNGGSGFPVQDVVMLQPSTCVANITQVNAVVAIRNDAPVTEAYIDYTYRVAQPSTLVPRYENGRAELAKAGASASPLYDLYTATFDVTEQSGAHLDLVVTAGGRTYKDEGRKIGFADC